MLKKLRVLRRKQSTQAFFDYHPEEYPELGVLGDQKNIFQSWEEGLKNCDVEVEFFLKKKEEAQISPRKWVYPRARLSPS